MDPSYLKLFKVLRHMRGGSYILQEQGGDLFPCNAAPSQLKLVSFESVENAIKAGDQTVLEVEALVAARGSPGAREYKVRWAGYGAKDDTWEESSHIPESLKMEYWERVKQAKKEQVVKDMAKAGLPEAGSEDDTVEDVDELQDSPPSSKRKRRRKGRR